MEPTKKLLATITKAARAGGQTTLKYFDADFKEKHKAYGDVCTEADLASEKIILEILQAQHPDYNVYSEEAGKTDKQSDYTFVIDPIDGTANFRISSPLYSVSIAVMKKEKLIAGVVYLPVLNDTFAATADGPATKNGQPIQVADLTTLDQAVISYGQGWPVTNEQLPRIHEKFYAMNTYRLTNNWSPALDLCWLASGKIHGVIANRNDLYDIAAGRLIAEVAGAHIRYLPNSQQRNDAETLFVLGCTESIAETLAKHCYDFK